MYPEYDPYDGSEILGYENEWSGEIEQVIEGADCFAPFASISPETNTLVLKLTGQEFTEMLSALYIGAEFTYPEKYLQIVVNFLKALHCPPEMEDEGGCINFKPYASFIEYEPQNPFNEPDVITEGYLAPAFGRGDTPMFPAYLGFQATDVMVRGDAIPVFTDWGDVFGLHWPTIKVHVRGEGQIEVDFLSVLLGGQCIVKVGSPPNILDLIDGIIETGVRVVDLNQDSIAIPPESDLIVAEEIPINAPEGTDVYFVFVPKLDVSTEFFGYGGGIRQIGLCGLETDAIMAGVEDIRLNADTYLLEKRVAGEWLAVENFNLFFDYTQQIQAKANDAWQFAYDLMQTTEHYSDIEGDDVGFTSDSPLKLYIDSMAGTPFDPSALEAAIAAAQADADSAQSAAAAAQSTANGAVSVNSTQSSQITAIQAVNTAQGISINNTQLDVATLQADVAIAQADITAIDTIVDILASGGAWARYHDFTLAGIYTSSIGSWSSGFGWNSVGQNLVLDYTLLSPRANQISYIEMTLTSATASPDIEWNVDGTNWKKVQQTGVGNILKTWLKVHNMGADQTVFTVRVRCTTGSFTVRGFRYLGTGTDIPFA